jgi:hypothetical protein
MHYNFTIHYIAPACWLYHHSPIVRLHVHWLCCHDSPNPSQYHLAVALSMGGRMYHTLGHTNPQMFHGQQWIPTPGWSHQRWWGWITSPKVEVTPYSILLTLPSFPDTISKICGCISFLLDSPAVMPGLVLITYSPLSTVTRHGLFYVRSSASGLSLTCLLTV